MGSAARAWCPGGRAATKATSPSPRRQRVDDLERGAGRQQRGVPRSRRRDGVGVDGAAAGFAEGAQRFEIGHGVDEGQLLLGGPTWLEVDDRVAQRRRRRCRASAASHAVRGARDVGARRRGGRARGRPPRGASPHCTAVRDRLARARTLATRGDVGTAATGSRGSSVGTRWARRVPRAMLHVRSASALGPHTRTAPVVGPRRPVAAPRRHSPPGAGSVPWRAPGAGSGRIPAGWTLTHVS